MRVRACVHKCECVYVCVLCDVKRMRPCNVIYYNITTGHKKVINTVY